MHRRLVFFLMFPLGLAACTDVPHRTEGFVERPECAKLYEEYDDITVENAHVPDEVRTNPCWLRAKEERTNYDLLIAEFDDQGWVAGSVDLGRPAKDRLGELFSRLAHIYDANLTNGLSLVVYVHGWHHDARAQDANITQFRRLLRGMATVERLIASEKKSPRVVGVYIGWRGESVTMWGVNKLTYWSRRDAADRVAQGSVRELFARLHSLRARGRTNVGFDSLHKGLQLNPGEHNVRMLTIGHSFGARIVFQALSSDLINAVTQASDGDYVSRFADLVVMINPALESIQYEPLMVASQRMRASRLDQFPVVIVAASTADLATGILFKSLRIFSTILDSMPGAQDDAAISALGHDHRYITHRLNLCGPEDLACANACESQTDFKLDVLSEARLMRGIRKSGFDKTGKDYLCGNLRLESTARWQVGAPFWVVSTADSLMKDHNDFMNPHFIGFIRQIYIGLTGRM